MTTCSFAFSYEIDPLGQSVEVEATVRLPPPGHPEPGDPENNGFVKIDSVTLNGCDVNPGFIKVARQKRMPAGLDAEGYWIKGGWVREFFLLRDLLRDAAQERAEMEAA